MSEELFITVPARARDEIGALAFYLRQMVQNLKEVNEHLRGSFDKMPGVLHDLRDIVRMTEQAAVKVLEEAEALIQDRLAASALVASTRRQLEARDLGPIEASLAEVQTLLERSDTRALTIMTALEFQDLTAQKIQGAFEVLEEVGMRLGRIQALVDVGHEAPPGPPAEVGAAAPDGSAAARSGQELADELVREFPR